VSDVVVTAGVTMVSDVPAPPALESLLPLCAVADPLRDRRISVRGVRQDLWDWLFVESARARVPIGYLLNVLMSDWKARSDSERRTILEQYRRAERRRQTQDSK